MIDIYLIPRLPSDAAEIGAILRDWRPDCLVASGLSTAARLAAKESPVPIVEVTLTPQWCRLANGHARFASSLLSHLSGLTGSTKHCELVRLAWGVPPDVVLHERSLIDGSDADVTGYPYADDWWADDQSDRTEDWIASGSDPVIACTFGSFFGYSSSGIFSDVRSILDLLGLRGVIVGARSGDVRETGRLRVIGRMPHSRLFPLTPVVIHHGGLGTSVAAIRAGRPAVVAPRAFDQPYNARLLEARGVALDASSLGLRSAIETIIGDLAAFERNVHRIRSTFSVPAETVQRAASSIERKAAEAQI